MIAENDRGVLLGDGIFDTLRVEDGRPLLKRRHIDRLLRSSRILRLGITEAQIEAAMEEGAEKLGGTGSLRTTITRGPGPRGLLPPKEPQPTIFTAAAPAGPRPTGAVRTIIAQTRRNEGSPATAHKTLGYLDNILARQEAEDQGAEEAIMLTNRGEAACTTIGNLIALREDGVALTPPTARGGVLPGVVRAVLLERGLLTETSLTEADLRRYPLARSNSLLGIQPLDLGTPHPAWAEERVSRLTEALKEAEAREP